MKIQSQLKADIDKLIRQKEKSTNEEAFSQEYSKINRFTAKIIGTQFVEDFTQKFQEHLSQAHHQIKKLKILARPQNSYMS